MQGQQQFQTYGAASWVPGPAQQPPQQPQPLQPQFFVPQVEIRPQLQPPPPHRATQPPHAIPQAPPQPGYGAPPLPPAQGGFGGSNAGMDPFLTGVAGNMLRQQGQSYLQRGQAFMQSKMGFLSGSSLHYLFSITPEYVRGKLLMLAAPFLRRFTYARVAEQISGGHKYLPPRQDVNAPDLYIPLMAVWTYCVLIGVAALARAGPAGGFRPETIYNTVSSSSMAWLLHTLLLKVILYVLGIPSAVPFLELGAYAGYPFVPACASVLVQLVTGSSHAYHVVWAYGSLCIAIFLVRSMKMVIRQESRTYSIDNTRHNYLLLGLAILQFPLNAWLARLPAGAGGAAAAMAGKAAKAAAKAAGKALL